MRIFAKQKYEIFQIENKSDGIIEEKPMIIKLFQISYLLYDKTG
jgi:hypothetical protein